MAIINLFQLSCFITLALEMMIMSLTTTAITISKPRRFVSKLIHSHHTVESPIESSAARFDYLQARVVLGTSTDDFRSGLVPDSKYHALFMANISIGEPPAPQLLAMDTGSPVLWTQCLPCTKSFWKPCFTQTLPVFDPSKSSTYAVMSCTTSTCLAFRSKDGPCDAAKNCQFSQNYTDGTATAGVVATEKLTFETSDEGITSVSNIVFGCANNVDSGANLNDQSSGILGLSNDNLSLATQLGSKFSYCLGLVRDLQYPHNQLILGEGARMEGDKTPVEYVMGLYFLTLEGITLGDRKLYIDPIVFKNTPWGGVIIDSGSSLTYLARAAFNILKLEVEDLTNGVLTRRDKPGYEPPCYEGVIDRDLAGFPILIFNFAGGADLALDPKSLFVEALPNQFCMAVAPSARNPSLSVIGLLAQQNYNIGYDLAGKTISFQRIDCELLETSTKI